MAGGEGEVQYRSNVLRGPANALGLAMVGGPLERLLAERKRRVFADLPKTVLEIGPGIGANFRYMAAGTKVLAVEPNPAMHARLEAAARKHGVQLELHTAMAESLDMPNDSVPMVISSLVLCTVQNPSGAVAEILRVLQAGGRYAFVEHVAAAPCSRLRRLQHAVRRPWAYFFEGCSCERELASVVGSAGFTAVELVEYEAGPRWLPVHTQIAGVAVK
ncbi:class I SAM-dependent methyltransferase [Arthrobacter sp. H35-D1]|uniref:class I SAM-dependent methyltransferase n=1 Tax=Arthrobacter sp. H35-D1 TaxID=3046202 RepID=UPI0024BA7253|nr:class I SAM-dependent methyltransferase [Arthrobacter sp. H35-D1]MDJ0311852.1 class I SAM-dependent methyltransferase [Arthrobacter sp. H35-D1]